MADQYLEVLRREQKYPVSTYEAELLKMRLSAILPLDPYCIDGKGYPVRSLYFDSMENIDFWEKQDGLEARKKIRLRTYKNGETVKLEWKQKQGNQQRKRSLLITKEDARRLINMDYACLKNYEGELASQFYSLMTTRQYRPVCTVEYDRTAFAVPVNDTRITLDSKLSWSESNFDIFDPDLILNPVIPLNRTTLEVKYNHFLLSYIKKAISLQELTEVSSSKYFAARQYALGGKIL